jgi:glutathione S-transferase
MFTAYGMKSSGNCYKVQLLLEQLREPYRWVEVDITKGESRTSEFLAKNPNGRVPLLALPDGTHLPESNAILAYLAHGTALFPTERLAQARVLEWLFFEQYSHEPYVAVARYIRRFLPAGHARNAELPRLLERGNSALAVMERHLSSNDFFADGRYTIADIALFAYTHCAGDGGFDLSAYPALNRWLERVRAQPGFVAMDASR